MEVRLSNFGAVYLIAVLFYVLKVGRFSDKLIFVFLNFFR